MIQLIFQKDSPSYFVFALRNEWLAKPDYYNRIIDQIVSPFDDVIKKELDWNRYYSYLKFEIDKPLFNETFSLRQIYIT